MLTPSKLPNIVNIASALEELVRDSPYREGGWASSGGFVQRQPEKGEVEIQGEDAARVWRGQTTVGRLWQTRNLHSSLWVVERQ